MKKIYIFLITLIAIFGINFNGIAQNTDLGGEDVLVYSDADTDCEYPWGDVVVKVAPNGWIYVLSYYRSNAGAFEQSTIAGFDISVSKDGGESFSNFYHEYGLYDQYVTDADFIITGTEDDFNLYVAYTFSPVLPTGTQEAFVRIYKINGFSEDANSDEEAVFFDDVTGSMISVSIATNDRAVYDKQYIAFAYSSRDINQERSFIYYVYTDNDFKSTKKVCVVSDPEDEDEVSYYYYDYNDLELSIGTNYKKGDYMAILYRRYEQSDNGAIFRYGVFMSYVDDAVNYTGNKLYGEDREHVKMAFYNNNEMESQMYGYGFLSYVIAYPDDDELVINIPQVYNFEYSLAELETQEYSFHATNGNSFHACDVVYDKNSNKYFLCYILFNKNTNKYEYYQRSVNANVINNSSSWSKPKAFSISSNDKPGRISIDVDPRYSEKSCWAWYRLKDDLHKYYFDASWRNSGTGIDNNLSSNNISIYPNPASDKIFIELEESDNYDVDVYNLAGNLVDTYSFAGKAYVYPVSTLPKGMYIINIQSEKNTYTKKFVIK